jgi:spore coat protein U-like protein
MMKGSIMLMASFTHRAIVLLGGACLALGAAPAMASTSSSNFAVTTTVVSSCTVSASTLAFGNYDPTSATDTDATTTLSVLCTNGTAFTVGLNAGTTVGGTVSARLLTSGSHTLGYALYQNAGRTTNWGNTSGTDTPASQTAGASATSMTVYGRIAHGQNVQAGAYSDTVTVTVNY